MTPRVPVVGMRKEPAVHSELVSSSYYSEPVTLIEKYGEWVAVTTSDRYFGWVLETEVLECSQPYPVYETVMVSRLQGLVYGQMDVVYGPILILPQGARLEKKDEPNQRWIEVQLLGGQRAYIQTGDVIPESSMSDFGTLMDYAVQQYIGIPYVWGGRTSFGFDCSGFVQRLYERVGIGLPRDAREQIRDVRFKEIGLDAARPGDLIFFGSSQEKIHHVGLFLTAGHFLHTTTQDHQPWVHVSALEDPLWNGMRGYRKVVRFCA